VFCWISQAGSLRHFNNWLGVVVVVDMAEKWGPEYVFPDFHPLK
jgi:hypothetical protein